MLLNYNSVLYILLLTCAPTILFAQFQPQDSLIINEELPELIIFANKSKNLRSFDLSTYRTFSSAGIGNNTIYCTGVKIPDKVGHWITIKEINLPIVDYNNNYPYKINFFAITVDENGIQSKANLPNATSINKTKKNVIYKFDEILSFETYVKDFYLFVELDYGNFNPETDDYTPFNNILLRYTTRFKSALTYNYYYADNTVKLKDVEGDKFEPFNDWKTKGFLNLKIKINYLIKS